MEAEGSQQAKGTMITQSLVTCRFDQPSTEEKASLINTAKAETIPAVEETAMCELFCSPKHLNRQRLENRADHRTLMCATQPQKGAQRKRDEEGDTGSVYKHCRAIAGEGRRDAKCHYDGHPRPRQPRNHPGREKGRHAEDRSTSRVREGQRHHTSCGDRLVTERRRGERDREDDSHTLFVMFQDKRRLQPGIHAELLHTESPIKLNETMFYLVIVEDPTINYTI